MNVNCTPNGWYSIVMTQPAAVAPAGTWHWIFAAGEKRSGIAGERDQIGLGQLADQPLRFQGAQNNIEARSLAGEICDRNAEGRCAGEQCARGRKYRKARRTAAGRESVAGTGFPPASTPVMPGRPTGVDAAHTSAKASVRLHCWPRTNSPRTRDSRIGRPRESGP